MKPGRHRDPHDRTRNSWERGIARDDTGLPYLDEKGSPIGLKDWGQTYRRKFQDENLA